MPNKIKNFDRMTAGKFYNPTDAGILLVLKYGSTSYDDLKEATRRAELSNTNIVGCVLNGIKRSGGAHNYKYKYKYKYKNYYSYGYGSRKKESDENAPTTEND